MARLSLLGAGKLLGGYCWALHEENKTLRTSGGGVRTVVIDPKPYLPGEFMAFSTRARLSPVFVSL